MHSLPEISELLCMTYSALEHLAASYEVPTKEETILCIVQDIIEARAYRAAMTPPA